jgi:hypothetical protein
MGPVSRKLLRREPQRRVLVRVCLLPECWQFIRVLYKTKELETDFAAAHDAADPQTPDAGRRGRRVQGKVQRGLENVGGEVYIAQPSLL